MDDAEGRSSLRGDGRRDLSATIALVAGIAAVGLVLAPPSLAVVGMFLAALGFGLGWQVRGSRRARVGVGVSILAALLLMPAIMAPVMLQQ